MGRIDRESGRVRGTARKLVVALAVVALVAVPAGYVVATDTFSDVPTSAFYHDEVNALVNAGVTAGCGGTRYCPNSAVTRGQMAVFLDRLGNLSGQAAPVVDAFTIFGQGIFGFAEEFELAGGAEFECESSSFAPFEFGEYAVQHQLYDIAATVGDIPTHEVLVSLIDVPDVADSTYEVCFRRVTAGMLPAGTYTTYGTAELLVGSGIFGGSSQARAKVAQLRETKAK